MKLHLAVSLHTPGCTCVVSHIDIEIPDGASPAAVRDAVSKGAVELFFEGALVDQTCSHLQCHAPHAAVAKEVN